MTEPLPILVGVDGSAASRAALRWATAEAARRHLPVLAAMVHQPAGNVMIGAVPYNAISMSGAAAEHADRVHELHEIVAETETHDVHIDQVVPTGVPGEELVRLSANAELLVLGSHGNRLAEIVLGTVSAYCARRANCPVVVLPRPVWTSDKEEIEHDRARG